MNRDLRHRAKKAELQWRHDPNLPSDEVVLIWLCSARGFVPKVRASPGRAKLCLLRALRCGAVKPAHNPHRARIQSLRARSRSLRLEDVSFEIAARHAHPSVGYFARWRGPNNFTLTLSATVLPEVMGPRARQRGAFLFGPP